MTVSKAAAKPGLITPLAVWFELHPPERQQTIRLLVKLAMASLVAQREPKEAADVGKQDTS